MAKAYLEVDEVNAFASVYMGRWLLRLLNCPPHLPDIIYYSAVHSAHILNL